MIAVLVVATLIIWALVAVVLGVVIGMGIAEADRREVKSCCPHPESEAPETVRGQFRAIVVLDAAPRGTRLDVQL